MTTEPTKRITATIKEITEAQGGREGTYHKLTTLPIGQQKYPNIYKVWDSKLLEGIKTGDTVTLTLERGRARIPDPQDDKDYYWEVVGIVKAATPGPVEEGPWPGDAPKPAAPFDRGIFIPVSPEGNKPPAPTKLLPIIAQGKPPFLTDTEQFLAKQDSIAWSVALQQATVLVVASIAKATDRASSDEIEQSVLRFARKFYADGQKVLREVV